MTVENTVNWTVGTNAVKIKIAGKTITTLAIKVLILSRAESDYVGGDKYFRANIGNQCVFHRASALATVPEHVGQRTLRI